MPTINLRDFYPWYTQDELIDVSDAVAEELFADRRYQRTHERTMRRHKVCSLDAKDGTMAAASVLSSLTPEEVLEKMDRYCRLCHALNSLPEVQGLRIEAHFLLGKSQRKIAREEGLHKSSVNESIEYGLRSMKKVFWRNFKNCPATRP